MEKLEGDITPGVMELLRTVPFSEVVKIKGSSSQESGLPDVLFTCKALGGRAVWIEIKAPGEEPRKLQKYKLDRWQRAGAISLVVHSVAELKASLGLLRVIPVRDHESEAWARFYAEDEAGRRMCGEIA